MPLHTCLSDEDIDYVIKQEAAQRIAKVANARSGAHCSLEQNVNVSNHMVIGDYCKIQNNVSLYEGVELEEGVFCGPSCVFINDLTPRAKFPEGSADYKKTVIKKGASIGANATIVCGHKVGEYAMVVAGGVVTKDVSAYALQPALMAWCVGEGDANLSLILPFSLQGR